MNERMVILGAGIAGLTTAWRLHQAGIPVTILEQSSHAGGCIRTMRESGYTLELGPNTFLNSSKELWDLAGSAGLANEKIETPREIGKTRYIFKDEKLIKVPAGPNILFSGVLSIKGRLRLLREPFIKPLVLQNPSFDRLRMSERTGRMNGLDESLASFITRRLGPEVLDTLVTPFVSGIYAGDPEKLSIKAIFPKLIDIERKFGSIMKGMKELKGDIKSTGLGSFIGGIGSLSQTLESKLKDSIIYNARALSIEKLNGTYQIKYEDDGEPKTVLAPNLICALPAYAASNAFSTLSDVLKENLSLIEYAPIAVVHTGYKKKDIERPLDGFGFLVPRKQKVRILGSLWSSALFGGRAPEGHALMTSFIGGILDPEALDLTNDDMMRTVQKDLLKVLGIKAKPAFACITRYTHAIPQYNIGHVKKIERITATLEHLPGLFMTGSYFDGISVAATIEHANVTAEKAIRHITKAL